MTQTLDFEAALTELEKVVGELDGDVKLDRALDLFDRGMKLSLDCEKFLKPKKQRSKQLLLLRRIFHLARNKMSTRPSIITWAGGCHFELALR
jgi:exodeoxyribonuclease VII small subunit